MIVTVTANTTLDHTVFVPSFVPNKTIRATSSIFSMGGKPTDASWILGEMGIPSLALGFAAGAIGQKVESLLHKKGVRTDFIQVEGETRINSVIIAQDTHAHTTITTTMMEVHPEHLAALKTKYAAALEAASCVVIGGTLPRGVSPAFYTEYITIAREKRIPVILDAAEPNLSAGLAAHPDFIKPNRDELEALLGNPIPSLEVAYTAGREILEQYGTAPVITLGGEGALAVLPDRAYRIPPLNIEVVSAAGAGDAVLAGLASAISRSQPIEDGLRLGMAAAAAVCLLPGTADCHREDVERLLPQVELIAYP
jgi:1-phosphofructokinase family hexose kinase